MKVYLAGDHAGFELKEGIKNYLSQKGFEVEDCGNLEKVPNDDYPDIISKAAKEVAEDQGSFGIFFGKSGGGEAIVANKINGIRAVVGFSDENVELSRNHNNANVLCLGVQFTSFEIAKRFVDIFLLTPFSNEERHVRRINKISLLEH